MTRRRWWLLAAAVALLTRNIAKRIQVGMAVTVLGVGLGAGTIMVRRSRTRHVEA